MCPVQIILIATVIFIAITIIGVEHFYYSPLANNKCDSCKLYPKFHGDGYDYQKHRMKLANQRGMKIGYGYSHDLRNNAVWTPFPVILYTMKKCRFCNEFEQSGTWDKLKAEYGSMMNFDTVQREDAPEYINSFPTIVAEINGDRIKYEGNRNHDDMRQWLNQLMIKK